VEHTERRFGERVAGGHGLKTLDGPVKVLERFLHQVGVFLREEDVDGGHHDDGIEGAKEEGESVIVSQLRR
jgi:hypothetical protein